jgi:hypothetical protein
MERIHRLVPSSAQEVAVVVAISQLPQQLEVPVVAEAAVLPRKMVPQATRQALLRARETMAEIQA